MSDTNKEKINYAEVLLEELNKHDLSYTSKKRDDEIIFTFPMSVDNAPGINVKLIIDEDGDCKLRSYLASNVPKSKWPAMYPVINKLNAEYRFVCLSLDKEGDICCSYDFTILAGATSVFAHVVAMLYLYTDIADNCIPEIMQTLWTKSEEVNTNGQRTIKANLFEEEEDEE